MLRPPRPTHLTAAADRLYPTATRLHRPTHAVHDRPTLAYLHFQPAQEAGVWDHPPGSPQQAPAGSSDPGGRSDPITDPIRPAPQPLRAPRRALISASEHVYDHVGTRAPSFKFDTFSQFHGCSACAMNYPLGQDDLARMEEADYVRWEVVSRGQPDCLAVPRAPEHGVEGSLPAATRLPWAAGGRHNVVSVICDTKWKDGGVENWQEACPRNIARRQLRELASMGLSLKSACEYEYRVFHKDSLEPIICGSPIFDTITCAQFDEQLFEIESQLQVTRDTLEPIVRGTPIFDTLTSAQFEEQLFEIESQLRAANFEEQLFEIESQPRAANVPIETLQMECGSAQFELTLAPQMGLDAADVAFRFRHGVKEMYQQKGQLASFMTKPLDGETANSGHYNMSLQPLSPNGEGTF
eukprot:gene23902-9469_t